MESHQIDLVQQSFGMVSPHADQVAKIFYDRLFELDPSLRPMFRGDLIEQRRKLMQTLSVVVAGLGRLHELLPAVRALGARHAGYGVQPEHFATVGEALLWTLRRGLGEAFNRDVERAWATAYAALAGAMSQAMLEAGAVAEAAA